MATKTLRVTLADILGVAGPAGRVHGMVWARFVDANGTPREIHYTDGTVVTIANPGVALNALGYADFVVVPNDDPTIVTGDQGFGIQIGWDLTARGPGGTKSTITNRGRTVGVTSAAPAVVQYGLLDTFTPVIPGTTYVTQSVADVSYPAKASLPRSLADFGVLPSNTAAQNRAGFLAAAASPYVDFFLPPGVYQWAAASTGQWMMTFTNKAKVRIRGVAATIVDSTTYSNNGPIEGLFLADNCQDVRIEGLDYVGPVLPTPDLPNSGGRGGLGYEGATLLRGINGSDGLYLDIRANNARYGLQTGDYSDPTKGWCKNIEVKIRGTMIGYPIAAYLAEGIKTDIDVDDFHRAAYIAGCNDFDVKVRGKNNHIAPVWALVTDALVSGTDVAAQANPSTAPTTSRASTNGTVTVKDKGSTSYVTDSYLAGISLSRVDPMEYKNIHFDVSSKATDTISTTIHGFQINSVVNSIWSRYPRNWDPSVVLDGITWKVNIDKTACTVATSTGSNGPVTIRTDDPADTTKFATIRNMRMVDNEIRPASSGSYIPRLYVRGLVTPFIIERFTSPNAAGTPACYVALAGSTTVPTIFVDSSFATLDRSQVPTALVRLRGQTAITAPDVDGTFLAEGGTIRGTGRRRQTKLVTTSALSGASVTLAGAIPAGATDVRITARVITPITGASGFQLGVTGDLTRYADRTATAAGSLVGPEHHAATAGSTIAYAAATDLVVTAKTANFTAGAIRIAIHYDELPPVLS